MQFDPNTWEAAQLALCMVALIVLVVALGMQKRK